MSYGLCCNQYLSFKYAFSWKINSKWQCWGAAGLDMWDASPVMGWKLLTELYRFSASSFNQFRLTSFDLKTNVQWQLILLLLDMPGTQSNKDKITQFIYH